MRYLVIGANGQVGYELQRRLSSMGEVVAVDYPDLDITDSDALRKYILAVEPDVLLNAAAYTAVDKAEAEESTAFAVNARAPGVMAELMAQRGGLLVHYSTDYVFDGSKRTPWVEEDEPRPMSAYGRTKLAGEQAVAAAGGAHLILRTAWVYGRRGGNFMLTMIRLMKERDELRVVADQVGTPTWCRTLANVPAQIIEAGWASAAARERTKSVSGVYHVTQAGAATWHEYAEAVRDGAPELAERRGVTVHPIRTEDYPLPAARPAYSVLDNGKLERTFGLRQADWRAALTECLQNG